MEGEKLGAHKIDLARHSPVFRRMLTSSDFTESGSGVIRIEDFKAGPVRAMLHYFSRGYIVDEMRQIWGRDIFRLADKYELLDLRAHIANHLATTISPTCVAEVAALADMHCEPVLKLVSIQLRCVEPHTRW
jgi:BTB/POZ domain